MADFGAIARPYARAVFEVANADGELAAWSDALAAAAAVLADDGARRHLASPQLGYDERVRFIESVLSDTPEGRVLASPHGRNLLLLLVENGRLAVLPEISAQFGQLKARAENKIKVTLTAATEVEDTLAQSVVRALEQRLGRAVELKLEVDDRLIGGAVIRAEDMVIDGSVRSRLRRLAESLVE